MKYKLQAWAWCMIRLAVYIAQLIHHAQACSLYFTSHTSRSGLQFIFHNSYITLRLEVYISQLIHYALTCSLYFTTHTSRSGLQFILHNSYITLRLAVYISQLIYHAQACSLYFITHTSRSGLQFIFTTHTLRSGLQFIFHNSYITLRLAVYISQLIHDAQAYSNVWVVNINCKPERDVWVMKYKLQAWAWYMSCEI